MHHNSWPCEYFTLREWPLLAQSGRSRNVGYGTSASEGPTTDSTFVSGAPNAASRRPSRYHDAPVNPAPLVPQLRAPECLDQKVHHDPHLRAEVAAARIDCQHVDLGHAVAGEQGHQPVCRKSSPIRKVGCLIMPRPASAAAQAVSPLLVCMMLGTAAECTLPASSIAATHRLNPNRCRRCRRGG